MKYKTLKSEEQRQLLLRVIDGIPQLAPLAWHLKEMRRCDDACRWLIQNNLTGRELYAFWTLQHGNSFLKVIAAITKGLEKLDKTRPVLVGRDMFKG